MNLAATTEAVTSTVTNTSIDVIVALALAGLFFAYGLYAGKPRLIAVMLAMYPAALLYELFPFWSSLPEGGGVRLIAFILFILVCTFFLRTSIRGNFSSGRIRRWVEAGVLSLLTSVLFFIAADGVVSAEFPIAFTLPFISYSILAKFSGFLLPIVMLFVFNKKDVA